MVLNSINKCPNGLTPMLETFVDLPGLITSMMLMLPSLIPMLMLPSTSTLPSTKDPMMKLGLSLIYPLNTLMLMLIVKITQLVTICVMTTMNGIMLKDLTNVLMTVVVMVKEPVLKDGAKEMPDQKTTDVIISKMKVTM
jgi:hypothetical protein